MRFFFIVLLVSIIVNLILFQLIGKVLNTSIYYSFLLNCVVSFFFLIKTASKRKISLSLIFWFYSYLFLSIVPYLQYHEAIWIYGVTEIEAYETNKLIFIYNFCFCLGFELSLTTKKDNRREVAFNDLYHSWTLIIILIIHLVLLFKVGFDLTSSPFFTIFGGYNPISILCDILLKTFIYFQFIIYLISIKKKKTNFLILIIQLYLFFYYNNPFASSRFYTLMVYLSILIVFIPSLSKVKFSFLLILFFGITGSYYQNILRSFLARNNCLDSSNKFQIDYFFQGHFDSFENIANTISYVKSNGIDYGSQLIGSIFFWVPRSVWPTKPEGSGTYLAKTFYNLDQVNGNLNISAPFLMEEYINFGLAGVIIVTILMGAIIKYFDTKYSYSQITILIQASNKINIRIIHYLLYTSFIGLFLFLLRGDLLSGISYSTGIICAFFLAKKLLTINCK